VRAFVAALASIACAPQQAAPPCPPAAAAARSDDRVLGDLAWLAGHWSGTSEGADVEEHWTVPTGGTMLGNARTVQNGKTVFFEYLRIEEKDGAILYLASPMGRDPPTPFTLVERTQDRLVFENPEHDFPQRIVYTREGDKLRARIEGVQQGKVTSSEWVYARVG
jgi:hypothetical protein